MDETMEDDLDDEEELEPYEPFEDDADERPDDFDCLDDFADPGGISALRAETPTNPRNLPCPTCGASNRLTPKDRSLGYCCDPCAEATERGGP